MDAYAYRYVLIGTGRSFASQTPLPVSNGRKHAPTRRVLRLGVAEGNPAKAADAAGSLPYAVFRLKRGAEYLRLDDREAQEESDAVYNKFPDLEGLGEKGEDGTVTIWPGGEGRRRRRGRRRYKIAAF